MEQLDPGDLLIFARVVEAGNLSRAAERLGVPKSQVSRRLAELERRLGERLLLRSTRRMNLTDLGQMLLEPARALVQELEAAQALGAQRQSRPSGRLRVSMPADLANSLLGAALAEFVRRYPDIQLELDLTARRADLLAEQVDLALRLGAPGPDQVLVAQRLGTLTQGLYASPDYLAAHPHIDTPEALLQHHALLLLGQQGQPQTWRLQRGNAHWSALPAARTAANAPELLARLAVAGAGLAALPDLSASAWCQQGRLQRVLPDWHLPAHSAWAVYPERRWLPAKTRVFLDLLQSVLVPALAPKGA